MSWAALGDEHSLRIHGWTDAGRLAVVPTAAVRRHGGQAAAGRFEFRDGDTWFVPRFGFVAGTSYTLMVDGAAAQSIVCPAAPAAGPPTVVEGLFPSGAHLPVNLLRVYVAFSAPMSEGQAADAVSLRDAATGEPLLGAFLDMDPELWDPARRRLTLLLDPGRLKRGLAGHHQAGYPLVDGRAVVLTVAAALRDADGRRLGAAAERRYAVEPPVRQRVDPRAWSFRVPPAGSREPLVVRFDRPLDRGLLEHALTVLDGSGRPLAGHASIDAGEGGWRFAPSDPWGAAEHSLVSDGVLEDLAGNSIRRVFDRDLTRAADDPLAVDAVMRPFIPGS